MIFFDNKKIFCKTGMGSISFPTYGELEDKSGLFIYLFSIDEDEFFLALEKQGVVKAPPAWEGWDLMPLFSLQRLQPKHFAYAALEASTLGSWYTGNRYCGRCGHEMVHSDTERALRCPDCGNLLYPKICPVAIVGVRNGDKLLLTKYKGRPQVPFYALIAGFAEVGESIEDTVRREVMEETGVHVKNLHPIGGKADGAHARLAENLFVVEEDHIGPGGGLLLRPGRGRSAPRRPDGAGGGGMGGPEGHPQPGRRLLPHQRNDRIFPHKRKRRLLRNNLSTASRSPAIIEKGSPERGAGRRYLIPREGTHRAAVGVCYLTQGG